MSIPVTSPFFFPFPPDMNPPMNNVNPVMNVMTIDSDASLTDVNRRTVAKIKLMINPMMKTVATP